jgi:hypothetical protein
MIFFNLYWLRHTPEKITKVAGRTTSLGLEVPEWGMACVPTNPYTSCDSLELDVKITAVIASRSNGR